MISCEIGSEHDLVSEIQKIDHVRNVIVTYGDYDVVVEAETNTSDEMNSLITTQIRKFEKIRSTITLRVTN